MRFFETIKFGNDDCELFTPAAIKLLPGSVWFQELEDRDSHTLSNIRATATF